VLALNLAKATKDSSTTSEVQLAPVIHCTATAAYYQQHEAITTSSRLTKTAGAYQQQQPALKL
jgi:hypothetical protein